MVLAAAQSRPFTAAMREVRMVLRDQVAIVAREQIGWRHRAVEEIRV
jgi:hypothetical protein